MEHHNNVNAVMIGKYPGWIRYSRNIQLLYLVFVGSKSYHNYHIAYPTSKIRSTEIVNVLHQLTICKMKHCTNLEQ
jgi:fatty-acid desaturase